MSTINEDLLKINVLEDPIVDKASMPGNSKKETQEKPNKAKRVVKAHRRKLTFTQKLIKTFSGEEVVDVKGYLINQVVVPACKNLVCDIFEYGPQLLLFGEIKRSTRPREFRGSSRDGWTSYDRYFGSNERRRPGPIEKRPRSDQIILNSPSEVRAVLNAMADRIRDCGQCTIGDLNDMVGITSPNVTDYNWGWDSVADIEAGSYKHVSGGFLLVLPSAISLR